MNNCIFCDLPRKRKSFETENFMIVVGKSIITEGHCMIIPKKHLSCIGEINKNLIDEYLLLKDKLFNFISKYFFEPFMVEYGAFAQSVFHAHIHFIPSKSDKYNQINIFNDLMFPAINKHDFEYFKFESFDFLQNFYKKNKQYVYFEQNNQKFVLKTNNYDSSVENDISYRQLFTNLGLKGISSWANMTEEDKIIDSIKIDKTKKFLESFNNFHSFNV